MGSVGVWLVGILLLGTRALGEASPAPGAGETEAPGGAARLAEGARQLWNDSALLVKAKAVLLDQKALQSRYLRVRARQGTVFLEGFVRKQEEADLAYRKLAELKGTARVVTSCAVQTGLGAKGEYETRVSEQAADLATAGKVRVAVARATHDGRVPRDTHVLAVDVFRGSTTVYAVAADAAAAESIATAARTVNTVKECTVLTVKPAREEEPGAPRGGAA
jgi:hypothetical protein